MNDWLKIIQTWLYPPTCVLCGDPGDDHRDLCGACYRALPRRSSACLRCGANLAAGDDPVCGQCQRQAPSFDTTVAVFDYEEPVRHLILGLKFHRRYAYGRLLGTLLAERVVGQDALPECIVPVPLHPARYRERGFNHTAEIARELTRRLALPVATQWVRRARATRPQVGLSADERTRNVRGAFQLRAEDRVRHVAVLDDVVTTGATVNELARVLKQAGVDRVDIWACARADRAR